MAVSFGNNWRVNRIAVFILTYVSYAFCHAARKTFSNVKNAMAEEWLEEDNIFSDQEREKVTKASTEAGNKLVDPFLDTVQEAEVFLGFLDTVFLVSYAVGLYVCGVLGDRINMRHLLAFGMTTSAIMMFLFGTVSEWIQYYDRLYYTAFWILNGFFQGTAWPTLVSIMGNWFGLTSRGLIFGLWSSSASVGNIIGAFSVSMSINIGYEYAFLTASGLLVLWSIIILIFLNPTPTDAGLVAEQEEKTSYPSIQVTEKESEHTPLTIPPSSTKPIGFIEAIFVPGVLVYSISYGFLKMVHYSMLFWLPFYLASSFAWSDVKSARFSMFYDIGGIAGGTIGGLFTDFAGRSLPVVMVMLIFSMISLFGYNFIGDDEIWNGIGMTLTGFFVCGVTHVVSSVVIADLGQQDAVKRQYTEALSTITGIVDGTGTLGAAVGQIIIPLLLVSSGSWDSVYYFLTIMLGCSTLTLLPVLFGSISSHLRGEPTGSKTK